MPLTLHGVWDSWGIVFDPIPFVCWNGKRKVRCWASLDALAELSDTASIEALDDAELANLFAQWVERFADLASDKYDLGLLQPDGSVAVTLADIAKAALRGPEVTKKAMGSAR